MNLRVVVALNVLLAASPALALDPARSPTQALPPGRYRREVAASNPVGRWNGTPAAVAFTIRPPFVKTPAFSLLCTAALGLTFVPAYRRRTHFEVVLAERTIHERVRVLGGQLRIESTAGAGTRILCRLPCDARAQGAESVAEEGP
jgi:hypothetical protein